MVFPWYISSWGPFRPGVFDPKKYIWPFLGRRWAFLPRSANLEQKKADSHWWCWLRRCRRSSFWQVLPPWPAKALARCSFTASTSTSIITQNSFQFDRCCVLSEWVVCIFYLYLYSLSLPLLYAAPATCAGQLTLLAVLLFYCLSDQSNGNGHLNNLPHHHVQRSPIILLSSQNFLLLLYYKLILILPSDPLLLNYHNKATHNDDELALFPQAWQLRWLFCEGWWQPSQELE